jgi:hypothetical protein
MAASGFQFIRDPAYGLPRIHLLETVWKVPIGLELEVANSQNRAKMSHLALLKHETQAIKNPPAIFQTVSLGR